MKLRLTAALGLSTVMLLSACAANDNKPTETTAPQSSQTNAAQSSEAPAGGDSFTPSCPGGDLKGEGSSAQKTAIQQVIQDYTAACSGSKVDYTPSGSGNGIKGFISKQVDWAGSDSALKTEEKDGIIEVDAAKARCGGNEAWNIPMVFGPIAIGYNVEGVKSLNLSGEVIAKIFDGKITKWNDPAIAALNDGVTLPDASIAVFHRADESGTTDNFTKFLGKASNGAWTYDHSKAWPNQIGEGKEKTAGVADAVSTTPNSISYMEWGAALERQVAVAMIDGVELNGESVGKAIDASSIEGEGNDLRLSINYTPGEGGYGAVLATYEIVCSTGNEKPELLKDFLGYFASTEAQSNLEALGYAPLPEAMQAKVAKAVSEIN